MAAQAKKEAKAHALEMADQVERELLEISNGERKMSRLSIEPIVRLVQFARTGTTKPATLKVKE